MEDTLRELQTKLKKGLECLNPCFNGRYSQSTAFKITGDTGAES